MACPKLVLRQSVRYKTRKQTLPLEHISIPAISANGLNREYSEGRSALGAKEIAPTVPLPLRASPENFA